MKPNMKFLSITLAAAFLSAATQPALSQVQQPQPQPLPTPDTTVTFLSLEDALKIAMSENVTVKIADKEITRTQYAKKGSYAALYPQVNASLGYQYTIEFQKMFMSGAASKLMPTDTTKSGDGGITFGYRNNWSAGVTATMPLVNAQLWESLKISADEVELSIEKARGSRLNMITEVKDAFYAVLWARDANAVYERVYENAKKNLEVTTSRYNAQKISEMDLVRAKTTVANAIPDVYNSRTLIDLSLWRLKAVMGLALDEKIDVKGSLADYAKTLFYDLHEHDDMDLSNNSSLKQLDIQIEELSKTIKMNQYAYIPSLALAFNYTYSGMGNNFNFSEYKWTPYSYVGLTLQIPIFSGFQRLNAVRQSKVSHSEMQLRRTDAERQLKIAVKSDLSTMETSMKSYYAAQSAVESAKKGYDISSKSYEVGRSTLLELNDAMLALSQAELMQWQAVYSFLTAKSNLEQQIGKDYSEYLE